MKPLLLWLASMHLAVAAYLVFLAGDDVREREREKQRRFQLWLIREGIAVK